jgi:3-isopropylmalate/(R)-2-methylmalate dehydratase large subunit
MTIVEKILANYNNKEKESPEDNGNVLIDARVASDFGGANIVRIIEDFDLGIDDPSRFNLIS